VRGGVEFGVRLARFITQAAHYVTCLELCLSFLAGRSVAVGHRLQAGTTHGNLTGSVQELIGE
jgi:hypothetical protein